MSRRRAAEPRGYCKRYACSGDLHPILWTHLLRTRELLELDRRMVPEARMQPPDVVEPIDVAGEHCDELGLAADLAPMQKLGFERMEEALHVGVVLRGVGTVHARDDRVSLEQPLIAVRGVFDAAVRMEHQARGRSSGADRALQRPHREFHA